VDGQREDAAGWSRLMTNAASCIAGARRFHFYAKYLWRFHRCFVRGVLSKRCSVCILSEAYSRLDGNGLCPVCRARAASADRRNAPATEPAPALARELDELLHQSQGRGSGAYDALVMLSGGKDSALLLHELKHRYPGLRLLALTIDNSFMSPVVGENTSRSVGTLDLAHVTLRPAKSFYLKSFRLACTLREAGHGCFETVDRIDADIGFSLAKIYAATNRIPLLVTGLSWIQVERLFDVRTFEIPPAQAYQKITSTLGRPLGQVYDPAEMHYWWDPDRFDQSCWPRFIHPFYVWRHEEQEIRDRVIELGLIKAGNESPLVTNNIIIPMMIAVDYLHLGYASFEPEFATQVRDGRADRVFWRNVFEMLEYAAKTGWMLEDEIDKIAKSLELTRLDVGLTRR
jgi:hypothetical protein